MEDFERQILQRWGSLKNKKKIWLATGILALVIFAGIIIVNVQRANTTYGKLLTNIVSEDQEVTELTIRYCNLEENADQDKVMTISDKHKINEIIEQSSDMKLKRISESDKTQYVIEMKTNAAGYVMDIDNKNHLITHGEKPIRSVKHNYEIMGQNKLVEAIE